MRVAKALILLFGAGAFVGAAVGLVVGSAWSESRLEALRDDVTAARAEVERANAQLRERANETREASSRSRVRSAGDDTPVATIEDTDVATDTGASIARPAPPRTSRRSC